MKILQFDILEGFKKGNIIQFENDNLNEIYRIYLYKNKQRFDVDGKIIRLIMLDKNKAGQVITLKKGETSNEILLPVTSELTKIDGVYDAQVIFTRTDGYNEKTIPFTLTIRNDLLTDMESELVTKEEYQYLVDRFDKAIRDIEAFKTEIINSNNSFKNEISLQVTENEKQINEAKDGKDSLNSRLVMDNEKVYETINAKDFLPFEGQNVTIDHSKIGYTKDMVIEGVTYQNLFIKHNEFSRSPNGLSSNIYNKNDATLGDLINKTVTIVNYSNKPITMGISKLNHDYVGGIAIKANSSVKHTFLEGTKFRDVVAQLPSGWENTDESLNEFKTSFIILEGDYTNKYIPPYFEGIKSVSEEEGNKISILSSNVSKYKIQQGTLGSGSDGSETDSYNRCRTTFINGSINNLVISNINFDIFQILVLCYNSSKKYQGTTTDSWATSEYSILLPNTEYVRIVFSRKDSANITPNDLINIKINEKDKKEILLNNPLRGFPNGVKDNIEQRKDGIYLAKRIAQKIFRGADDEKWGFEIIEGKPQFNITLDDMKAEYLQKMLCDVYPVYTDADKWANVDIGVASDRDNKVWLKLPDKLIDTVAKLKSILANNNMTIYYKLATPVETKLLDYASCNLETFLDTTHIMSTNSINPNLKFKAPVDVPATISTLRTKNEDLKQENEQLKEDVDFKTLALHEHDVELTTSSLDLDFRMFEIEMNLEIPMKLNTNMKGMMSMARSPFEMMKVLILNNSYDREDIEYKASRYLKGGRMSQLEHDEIISLMDANELA